MPNRIVKKVRRMQLPTGTSPAAPSSSRRNPEVLLSVAHELFAIASDALTRSGVSRKEQQAAFARAILPQKPKVSISNILLERTYAIAELMTHWKREKRFSDTEGNARVLSIYGKGTTFEALCNKFVPDMPVKEVFAAVVRHGEVMPLKGDKVALVGTSLMNTPKTAEATLAALTIGFKRLTHTIMTNAARPESLNGEGLFERQVLGALTESEFQAWSHQVRRELQEFCEGQEMGLRRAAGRRRKRQNCGITISIFKDE